MANNRSSLGFFKCRFCAAGVRTAQGLKSHLTRLHKDDLERESFLPSNPDSPPAPSSSLPACPPNPLPPPPLPPPGESESDRLVKLLACLKANSKILRRIPKGARISAAEALTDSLDLVVRDNSFRAWERLFVFAGIALQVPPTHSPSSVSLTTQVKRNIGLFRRGDDATSKPPRSHFARRENVEIVEARFLKSVEAKIADGDVVGAVRLLSSDASLAECDEATLDALLAKHPPHDDPETLAFPEQANYLAIPPIGITDAIVREAVFSFPPGTAGGLDSLKPQHLKDLLGFSTGNAGLRLLSSLSRFCALLLQGAIPPEICPILYGASLCALKKKDGSIRPVAVGNTFRRIAAKVCCRHIMDRMGSLFRPIQLGFGTKGGAEAATHAARRFVAHVHSSPMVLLKIDFANAFNSIRRDCILQSVSHQMPELFPFVSQCYRNPSHLVFGQHLISSQRGVQQGDPLGPALFCSVIHSLVSSLSTPLNLWFLDDGALGGPPALVLQNFKTIVREATNLGLDLNFRKCELFLLGVQHPQQAAIKEDFLNVAPNIRFPTNKELSLLGAPIHDDALSLAIQDKTSALQRISNRLSRISNHVAFYILKFSQAIPKLLFLMRCAPTWKRTEDLQAFDAATREACQLIANTALTDQAWNQATLPIKMGGLGLKLAVPLSTTAFLASLFATSDLVNHILPDDITSLDDPDGTQGTQTWMETTRLQPPAIEARRNQKSWEAPILESRRRDLFDQATNPLDKARLLGVASSESGAFLTALPSVALGTFLENNAFRIAIGLRLGIQIVQPHLCSCGEQVDMFGLHGLNCKKNAGRISRHANANDIIKRSLVSAGFPTILEPSFLSRDNNKRPDGITQIPWANGKSLVWDFTCANSLAPSYLPSSSMTPLFVANSAETKKRRKYEHLRQSHCFHPISAECLGSFGEESIKLIRKIGKAITGMTGERRSTEFLLQRLSGAIQRGNAACVTNTYPQGPSMGDYLDLL